MVSQYPAKFYDMVITVLHKRSNSVMSSCDIHGKHDAELPPCVDVAGVIDSSAEIRQKQCA